MAKNGFCYTDLKKKQFLFPFSFSSLILLCFFSFYFSCFYALIKTPLGEIGCQFTPLFQTKSVRPPLVLYHSLCSTCRTYRTPWCSTGQQVHPTHPTITLHTLFTSHQNVLLGRFYLSVRICYGLLYKPVTGFEPIS